MLTKDCLCKQEGTGGWKYQADFHNPLKSRLRDRRCWQDSKNLLRITCKHTQIQLSHNDVCVQNSFDSIYKLLWTLKSGTILNHKPRQRKTAPANQKHLSCERFFRGVCWDVRCIPKCNFFFFFLKTREWIFLSLWKPSMRIFNTWPHQNPNHIREAARPRERRGGRERVRHRQKWGRWRDDGNGQQTTTSNHNTPYQKDGWGRRQTAIHPLQHSKFLFLPCISFCVPFIHFLAPKFSFSHLSLSLLLHLCHLQSFGSLSLFFILFLSAFLSHLKFQFTFTPLSSPFSLPQPLSPPCSFIISKIPLSN